MSVRRFYSKVQSLVRKLFIVPILLYQKLISPLFPRTCRYYPSCSEFSRQAVLRHGVLRGGLMALGRIFRCWGWFSGGNDPVPEQWHPRQIFSSYHRFYRGPGHQHKEDGNEH